MFGSSGCERVSTIVVLTVAVTIAILSKLLAHRPVLATPGHLPHTADAAYDLKVLATPSAAGATLRILAWIIVDSPIGSFVRRFLLNQNNFSSVRDFAAGPASHSHALFLPVYRANAAEHEAAAAKAAEFPLLSALRKGLTEQCGLPPRQATGSTVEQLAAAYRAGSTTPTEVARRVLKAVEEAGRAGLGSIFISIKEREVLAAAQDSDARIANGKPRSIFEGVPISVKDMIAVKGHPITEGSVMQGASAVASDVDDIIVARFRAAGAVIVGTTTMTEHGVTPLGYSAHWHGPFNPYNTSHFPGGSSSGSAVSVATGMVPVSVGFDGGGSIRIPACLSGVVGFGNTFMRVPFDGDSAGSTVIKTGVLAATTRDAALAYTVMAPNELKHPFTEAYGPAAGGPPAAHLAGICDTKSLADVKLGVFEPMYRDADPVVLARVNAVRDALIARGATVVPIVIPHLHVMSLAHAISISAEFSAGLDNKFTNDHPFEPSTRVQLSIGSSFSGVELFSAYKVRAWGFSLLRGLFKQHNLTAILSPTVGFTAPEWPEAAVGTGFSDSALLVRMMRFIFMANLLGFPGMSVPAGYDDAGLPIGVHFMGNHWGDEALLRLAAAVEDSTTRSLPPHFWPLVD